MTKENFVYELNNTLYINLTNRCTNSCNFCIRNNHNSVGGKELWLTREPSFEDVIAQLPENVRAYKEAVFCGFGEPTCRLEVLTKVGKHLKTLGMAVRLNTNGQGNLFHGRDITGDLAVAVDIVNVSLNASNAKEYQRICQSEYGDNSFNAMLDFAKLCKEKGLEVIMSVIDIIGKKEIAACQKLCEEKNLNLRVRTYE